MFEDERVGPVGEVATPAPDSARPARSVRPPSPATTAEHAAAGAVSGDTPAETGECCEHQAAGGVCDHMIAVLEQALALDRAVLVAEEAELASLSPAELAALAAEGYPAAVNHLDAGPGGKDDASVPGECEPSVYDGWVEAGSNARQGLGVPVDVLAALEPGPELAAEINAVDLASLDEYALVEVLAAARRVESWAAGLTAAAAAQLSRAEVFDPARFGSQDPEAAAVPEEIAMRLGVSRAEAKKIVTVGQGLTGSFTATGQALRTGQIDWQKAATIVTTLRGRPDAVAWFAEQEVLERAGQRNVGQLTRDLAKVIVSVDAEDAGLAHKRANRSRHVTHPRPLPDGMASMYVVGAAQDLVGVDLVLDAVSAAAKACGDSRTRDQLRADTLFTLASGALESGWVGAPPTWATGGTKDGRPEPRDEASDSGDVVARALGPDDAAAKSSQPPELEVAHRPGRAEPPDPGTGPPPASTGRGGPRQRASAEARPPDADDPRVGLEREPGMAHAFPPDAAAVECCLPGRSAGGDGRGPDDARCCERAVAAQLGVLPELLGQLRRRSGMRLGDARTNRTEVRVVVPLSVVLPPSAGPSDLSPVTAAPGVPPAEECWAEPEPSEVAELIGYGPITPDVARAIAAGGTWRRIVTDPLSGAVIDVGRRRYRPPAELATFVRERDRTCIRPGCSTPATRCQLDHTIPASQGGTTSAGNLGPACERDHGIKTNGQAKVSQPSPGVFEWITPTGHAYRRNIDGTTTRLPRGYPVSGTTIPF